jgi:hypothetical protein
MSKKIEYPFPIFTIQGDESFDEKVQQLATVNLSIQELSSYIVKIEDELTIFGNRLNLYINNILSIDNSFDYQNHTLVFDDNNYIYIYKHDDLDKFVNQLQDNDEVDEDDIHSIFNKIIDKFPSDLKFKLSQKSYDFCDELTNQYNLSYSEYDYSIHEVNELNEYYDDLMTNIRKELLTIKPLDVVYTDGYEVEAFDDTKHELLITKDKESSSWKLIYINKSDKDEFLKILQKYHME